MWNVRQETDDVSRGYGDFVRRAQADAAERGLVVHRIRSHRIDAPDLFTNVRRLDLDNPQVLDLPGLLGRARSASYFPPPGPLRAEVEADLTALFHARADDGRVVLRQQAEVTLADAV